MKKKNFRSHSLNVKILVACHKADPAIRQDDIYMPIHVGKALHPELDLGFQGDDTGDNISEKNGSYCELTAMYWAWKNLPKDVDIVGLCHYRRYFDFENNGLRILNQINGLSNIEKNDIALMKLLEKYDIVLSKKFVYPYNVFSAYAHEHISVDMMLLDEVIKNDTPDYYDAFLHLIYNCNTLSPFNMFVMRHDLFDEYCEWVFDVLEKIEEKIDYSKYDSYQKRVFGFLSERLLNVYVEKKRRELCRICYRPVMFIAEKNSTGRVNNRLVRLRDHIKFFMGRILN